MTNILAQLSLRKGMMKININFISFSKVFEIASSLYIWSGLLFYGISFILYLYVLSKFEVSQIYPIIMSAGFILLLIFSVMFLNETFTLTKIIGIFAILV
ncbi:MAG: 4-amino-4-deoxy-L-arabinose transferase [Bacteroidetes bacterium]|nr:4-amino-4-deoxy-L-arabinose transferase [Bacteroidota bacterium]